MLWHALPLLLAALWLGITAAFTPSPPVPRRENTLEKRPRTRSAARRPMPLPLVEAREVQTAATAIDPQTVDTANDYVSAFAGGTVGVMGTLVALELKKFRVKERSTCPYCSGAGKLVCAQCFGSGSLLVRSTTTDLRLSVPCPCCGGKKGVVCTNCRGDGRAVPLMLDRKASRDPESQLEEIGLS